MILGDRGLNLFRGLAVLLVVIVVIRTAWLSDDALITLRTALNLSHGWGPGYNATEAVQGYTHPLWFLLWLWIGSWTNQWILGVFGLSTLFVGLAALVLARQAASLARLILVFGLLLLSNGFIDFTTSGLENPLAFAAISVLFVLTVRSFRNQGVTYVRSLLLGLTAAAVMLTRLDLVVLIAVPLAVFAWRNRRHFRQLIGVVVGFSVPFGIWFLWSWITYSAVLPNTFAAKTNAAIPRPELVTQGLRYLWVSFENDPATLIGLAAGIGVGLVFGPRMLRAWSLGVTGYLGYIVWIGGDFMGGRFLSVPFFVALLLLASSALKDASGSPPVSEGTTVTAALATIAVAFLGISATGTQVTALTNPQSQRWEVDQNFNAGIVDARGSSVSNQRDLKGLIDNLSLAFLAPDFVPIGDGSGLNRPLRDLDKTAKNWPRNDGSFILPSEVGVFCGFLGTIGIVTGPTTHLIDDCALTDRFLAQRRFTPAEPFAWKPGHFHRGIPEGYVEAVATNDPTKLSDMADRYRLEQLWSKIRQ